MEYKAEMVKGKMVIHPIVEKKTNKKGGQDVKIKVPSLSTIQKAKEMMEKKQDGKRDL